MTVLRDLRGLRTMVLVGAAATVLGSFLHPLLQEEPGAIGPAFLPLAVAAVLMVVAGTSWLRGATINQRRLGVPVEGVLWLRVLLAGILPVVGAFLLFQLAARIVDASGRAAGRADRLGAWFAWWFAAYLLSDVADVLELVAVDPVRLWVPLGGLFLLLAVPGLARFLRTVERDQEQAAGVQAPPAAPPASPAPSDG